MTTHTRSALLLVLLTSLIALGCGSSSKTVDGDIDVQVGGNDILGTSDSTVTQDVPTFDFSLPPADATIDLVSLDVKQEDAQVGDTSTADQPTSDAVLGDLTADTDDGGTLDSTVSDAGDQTGDSASDLSGDTQVADLAELDGDDGADGVVPNDSTDISEDDGSADATGDSSSDGDALSCVDDDLGTTAVGVLSATPLTSGTYENLKLCEGAQADWYRIEVPTDAALIIDVTSSDGVCYDFELYQHDSVSGFVVVHYSNATQAGENGQVYNMSSGTYYLQVHAFECDPPFTPFTNGTYKLRVQIGCNNVDADCASYSENYYQACINDVCKHCKSSTQCASHPFGAVCDTDSNLCGCNEDADCANSEYGPTCFGLCGCDPNGTPCKSGYSCVLLLSDPVFYGCVPQ